MKLRIYNETLEPNLWNNDKTLKPEIRDALLKVAEDFYKSTDLKSNIHNILFLGSSANYNWNPTSDIDVHVIIDIAEEKINEEYARKFMDTLAFKWNTEHDIEVKRHPVEVYLQDVREPNSNAEQARKGAAIYSLFDNKWILEPIKHNIPVDVDKIKSKFKIIKKKINNVLETEDTDKLKDLMKSIRNYRDAGLSKGGEFSVENLVFKCLRYNGDLKNLKDSISSIYDRKRSLPEEGNVLPHKKTQALKEEFKKDFLIVGTVDDDLNVEGEIDYVGKLPGRGVPVYHPEDTHKVCWRYKSKDNVIYWRPDTIPTEKQKDAVVEWLRKKNINNPTQRTLSGINYLTVAHKINEESNDFQLYLGLIDIDGYETIGVHAREDLWNHHDFAKKLPFNWKNKYFRDKTIGWRYKKNTNKVYWYIGRKNPNEEQKESVNNWLYKHAGTTTPPTHVLYSALSKDTTNFDDSHKLDEIINKK